MTPEVRKSGARRARSGRANTGEHRVREVRQEVLAAAGERARARGSSWGVSGGEPPAGLRRGALRAASLPGCVGRGASGGRLAAWRCAPALQRPREQPGCVGRGASGGPAARGAARGKLAGVWPQQKSPADAWRRGAARRRCAPFERGLRPFCIFAADPSFLQPLYLAEEQRTPD